MLFGGVLLVVVVVVSAAAYVEMRRATLDTSSQRLNAVTFQLRDLFRQSGAQLRAAASAIVAETKRRARGSVWYVAVPAYAIALTPGLARMYLGQHWASDIFAGAFLGTFYGWRVVDYSHDHKQTAVDKVFLGVDRGTAPRANEYKIGWTVQF